MWYSNRWVTNLTGVILCQATAAIHVHWQPWGACQGEGGGITGGRRQVQLAWAEEAVWEGLLVILICDLNQNLKLIQGAVSRGSCSHSVVTAGGGGQARCCGAEEHLRQGAPVRLLTFVKYQPFKEPSVPASWTWLNQTNITQVVVERSQEVVRQPGWRDVLKVPCSFLYLSELISGIIQYLVLLCLPRANTRSHHHLMLTSHSDAKSLAVSEARLSDLNPYSEDEKIILGSILWSTLLHRDDQDFFPALPWASRWCFWAARLKSTRQEEESWMRWTRIILWSVNRLYRPHKGIVIFIIFFFSGTLEARSLPLGSVCCRYLHLSEHFSS